MPYDDPEKRRANWFKNHEQRLARQRAYYQKHREKRLAAKKATYDAAKQKEKNERYYAENQETLVQYARDYRKQHQEELAEKARARYHANSEQKNARRKELLSESPERRAKRYAGIRRWLEQNPDKAFRQHAKRLLAEQTGYRVRDIPNDVAEAKVEQLKITRWVREQLALAGEAATAVETPKSGSIHEHATAQPERPNPTAILPKKERTK